MVQKSLCGKCKKLQNLLNVKINETNYIVPPRNTINGREKKIQIEKTIWCDSSRQVAALVKTMCIEPRSEEPAGNLSLTASCPSLMLSCSSHRLSKGKEIDMEINTSFRAIMGSPIY